MFIRVCANHGKNATQILATIKQTFQEESMSGTLNVQSHQDRKKGETDEKQSQEHAHRFLSHQGDWLARNSSWQAKQSIPYITVTFIATA
jgi:hypothetical protein